MTNVKTTITIDKSLSKQIKLEAIKHDMTIAEYIEYIFDKAIKGS